MLFNRDYRTVLKRGAWLNSHNTIKNQIEAGYVVAVCLLSSSLLGIIYLLTK